jgi:hypothetical protein
VFLSFLEPFAAEAKSSLLVDQIVWPEFLARHDLVWTQLPAAWTGGAFLGNGLMGAMIYAESNGVLRLDVGRSDVVDHRKADKNVLIDRARLPIGNFLLVPTGKVSGGKMRLDLWNAEAEGTLTTEKGSIEWRAFVHADEHVIVVELKPSDGEKDCKWQWVPALSESPRVYGKGRPADYKSNPPPKVEKTKDGELCVQPLLDGGEYATAWRDVSYGNGSRTLYISVGYSWPGATSAKEAADAIGSSKPGLPSFEALLESHRKWWHAFYPHSFLSIPDTRMEGFYWTQIYKLASATRADRPAIDLMGPWYKKTIWPGIWWNLNLQLTYYPVYTANRLELGESLARMLENNVSNLVANVKFAKFGDFGDDSAWVARVTSYDCAKGMFKGQGGAPEVGNLPWICENYWRQCRYAADDVRMKEKMLPLLRRAINFYLHMLKKGPDGKYHLPVTYSPEYGFSKDLNYDLSLLRWGCQTLVQECTRLAIDDPLMSKWEDVLVNLVDFPVDENGFRLGADEPFSRSHRHYSHLLMIYPLYVINWDQPENRTIIEKSVARWVGLKGAFAGYSFTGAASMYASMGRGNDAYIMMNDFIDRVVEPNTMYLEADSPVIETPLSGAQSIQDMLLQSWSGKIRVFPGVPDAWKDVAFRDLRAEGAFLVSAARKDGKTQWVRVKSLAGEPCRIKPALEGVVKATIPLKPMGEGVYALELKKGEDAILYTGDTIPMCDVTPVIADQGKCNYFGSGHATSIANASKKKK